MQKVNFDKYSNKYNEIMQQQHSKFGDISYYSEYKINILKSLFKDDVDEMKILEYGCGVGRNLPYIKNKFPTALIYGYDISQESIEIAKIGNPTVTIMSEDLILSEESFFDIIFIAGVYHHIAPNLRDSVTQNIFRLLKNHGRIVFFEHNPYNPFTRHMVNTCEFDEDAVLLSKKDAVALFAKNGFKFYKSKYTLFVPPKLKSISFIEKFIYWLPLGGQYYVVFYKETSVGK